MPEYDYGCPRCGIFSAVRPMTQYAEPFECPECGQMAPRVQLSAPAIGGIATGYREQKGNSSPEGRFAATAGHGAGCRCCFGGRSGLIPKEEWKRKLL